MRKDVFIVGSIDKTTGNVSFSNHPHEHLSEREAKIEAERLAQSQRHKKFVVAKIVGVVEVNAVSWS